MTIANQAAVAIAHANSYAELEAVRDQQASAWREERASIVETLAAEIAHEIRHPLNFFRSLFHHGQPLEEEDVIVGREEVERLERLTAALRRLALPRLHKQPTRLADLVAKTEVLLRDRLPPWGLMLGGDRNVMLDCDPDQVTQVFVNLVANALDASPRDAGGSGPMLGISVESLRPLTIVFWDRGDGFVGDPARLFDPWHTTKPRGMGLGLAVTHRIVRVHGWHIACERRDGYTRFIISIPEAMEPER